MQVKPAFDARKNLSAAWLAYLFLNGPWIDLLHMPVSLVAELIQEIACYLQSHRDVTALSLANRRVQGILNLSLIYKQRLINAGWDTRIGYDIRLASSTPYWKFVDLAFNRIEQLVEAAKMECFAAIRTSLATHNQCTMTTRSCHGDLSLKVYSQLCAVHCPKVFECICTLTDELRSPRICDSPHNMSNLLSEPYCEVWRDIIPYITLYPVFTSQIPANFTPISELLDALRLHRCAFSMVTLFVGGSMGTGISYALVTNGRLAADIFFSNQMAALSLPILDLALPLIASTPLTIPAISRCFAFCFNVQTLLLLKLRAQTTWAFEQSSNPWFDHVHALDDLQLPPFQQADLRWTRGIAGTPLHRLLEGGLASSARWHGCSQTYGVFFLQKAVYDVIVSPVNPTTIRVRLVGTRVPFEHPWVGNCDVKDGSVLLVQLRDDDMAVVFNGIFTPWGMVGRWGEVRWVDVVVSNPVSSSLSGG
ncbi:hypothetical protein OF83DRAFT_1085127 [Amylostereum chailletii]|nr:hypothetical protein OF83DRAFT_1085127 [Amylostereum chailletii]